MIIFYGLTICYITKSARKKMSIDGVIYNDKVYVAFCRYKILDVICCQLSYIDIFDM
jgi:hypothetical protein